MRISDWSSDVCSSDLRSRWVSVFVMPRPLPACPPTRKLYGLLPGQAILAGSRRDFRLLPVAADRLDGRQPRSEERRCRERVCQYVLISVVAVTLKKTNDKSTVVVTYTETQTQP